MILSKKRFKGNDQSARMGRLVCAFVVCTLKRQVFSCQGPYAISIKILSAKPFAHPNLLYLGLVARKPDFVVCKQQKHINFVQSDQRHCYSFSGK